MLNEIYAILMLCNAGQPECETNNVQYMHTPQCEWPYSADQYPCHVERDRYADRARCHQGLDKEVHVAGDVFPEDTRQLCVINFKKALGLTDERK